MVPAPNIELQNLTSTLPGAISHSLELGMKADEVRPSRFGASLAIADTSGSESAGDEATKMMTTAGATADQRPKDAADRNRYISLRFKDHRANFCWLRFIVVFLVHLRLALDNINENLSL